MGQSRTDIAKKEMINALKEHKGCVLHACEAAKVGRTTHYRWLEEDEEYRNEILNITEGVIDFAENKLIKLIEEGDTTATIFFLKTKGKKRGYVEKSEVDVNAPINLSIEPFGKD